MKIGNKIKVKNTDIVGKITIINNTENTLRIEVIEGKTAVTDYYFDDVEQVFN